MRAIPNAVFLAPWFHERQLPAMPREMFDLLSEHGRRICDSVVTDEPIKTGYTFDPAPHEEIRVGRPVPHGGSTSVSHWWWFEPERAARIVP